MNNPTTSNEEKNVPLQGAAGSAMNSSIEANGCTEEEILSVLNSKNRWLTFPAQLEAQYLDKHIPRSIRRFHVLLPILLLLFLIMTSGIIGIIPKQGFTLWLTIVISATTATFITIALSFFSRFNHWFKWYGLFGGVVVVAATIMITHLFPLGQNSPLLYVSMVFAVFIIYTCVGVTFLWGLWTNLLGGLSAIVLMNFTNLLVNWSLLNRIYFCACILGLGLSYALESQERQNFLNTLLLRANVKREKELATQLEALSRQDAMTGLANRRHLDEVLDSEVKRALRQYDPLTIMIIDVDYFKTYNDTQGHLAGDECLRHIAKLLLSMAKRGGELAARYGGEEFVLVYPAMDAQLAKQQAIRLLESMATLALPHPNGTSVTFSIGITVYEPTEGETNHIEVEQLLRHADQALYMAKKNGRNRYEFFREKNAALDTN
ncbi:MAG: GGDEF domain-containing protein [Aquirhabdus sp.]